LHGMQEVSGSIPLSSTKIVNPRQMTRVFFYLFVMSITLFCYQIEIFLSLTSIDINKPVHK